MKNYSLDMSENYKEFIKNTVYVDTVSANSRNKYLKYGHTFETTFWLFRTWILHEFQINGVRIAVYMHTLAC